MTDKQRAEALMAKGPIWLVRRVMELERQLAERERNKAQDRLGMGKS